MAVSKKGLGNEEQALELEAVERREPEGAANRAIEQNVGFCSWL